MSEHKVEVVKIEEITKHPNADTLDIVKIWGYDCIVRIGDFKPGDLAIYVEPDYVVDLTRPQFAFLDVHPDAGDVSPKWYRIRSRRLRGIWSQGLLLPLPKDVLIQDGETFRAPTVGDNVIDHFGIERYEPKFTSKGGSQLGNSNAEDGPELSFDISKYDLENYRKYHKLISEDEKVIYTVKVHGTSARFCFYNDRMYCGSRKLWTKKPNANRTKAIVKYPVEGVEGLSLEFKSLIWGETEDDCRAKVSEYIASTPELDSSKFNVEYAPAPTTCVWWSVLEQHPWVEQWCRENPGCVLYGEVFGPSIQGDKFHYGIKHGNIGFYAFDILENGAWRDNIWMLSSGIVKTPPIVYHGNHDPEVLKKLAEEKETINSCGHLREGIVVKLQKERMADHFPGRWVRLKYVSNSYLEKS